MIEPVKKLQEIRAEDAVEYSPEEWAKIEFDREINFWRHDPYGDECVSWDDDDQDDEDPDDDAA